MYELELIDLGEVSEETKGLQNKPYFEKNAAGECLTSKRITDVGCPE